MTAADPLIKDHSPPSDEHTRASGSEIDEDGILRVKSGTSVKPLASAIAHHLYAGRPVVLRCVGAAAVGQGIKALAVARSFAGPVGIDIAVVPAFDTIEGSRGDTISAITLRVVRLT